MSKKKVKGHVSQHLIPDTLDSKEISFTNLLLLGFEPNEYERRYSIPFNRDMFVLPNKKAFEVVMHFLFERLNPAMAHEKFRDCWPIYDKKQEQTFRKTITNQLTEIAAEDPVANLPRIVPSLFMSPGGERFYSLLLHFSHYVLYKAIKQENGKKDREILHRPKLLPTVSHLGHIMLKTTQAAAIRHRRRFLERSQLMVMLHQEWKEFASELVRNHRSLTKQIRDLEHNIRDCQASSYDLAQARGSPVAARRRSGGMMAGERQVQAVKRTPKIQKVRKMWKALDALYVDQSQERDVVTSVLQVENKYRLDAGEINVQVPGMLIREYQQDIHRRNIGNTYEGGKLNLVTLLQLWNLSLQSYLEKIHQAPMPRFEELSPDLVTQVHTHHVHLANTQAMRSTLTNELLPELKKTVNHLSKEVGKEKTPSRKATCPSFQLSSYRLELLPPTPPVSFEPATGLHNETPTRLSAGRTLKNNILTGKGETFKDTPQAVSELSDTINKTALRRAGLAQGTPTSALGELKKQMQGISKLSLPPSMSGRKRVKSAPSKVRPSPSQSPPLDVKLLTPSTPGPTMGMSRKKENEGATQPKKKLRGRQSLDGRKDLRKMEKLAVRNKVPLAKPQRLADIMSTPTSVPKTPVSRFKSDLIRSSSTRPKSASRAQQILAEQIADAVTTGGKITPDFLDLLRSDSRESSPLGLALENPLASLDQGAFVSKDKLTRTPEGNLNNSGLTETPHHVVPTGTLFELENSPDQQNVIGRKSTTDNMPFSPLHELHKWNSVANDSQVSVLERGEYREDFSFRETGPKDQGGSLLLPVQVQDHVLTSQAPFDNQTLDSPDVDDFPLPERRPEFRDDLEQALADIFLTRTPQLSTRSKSRLVSSHKQGVPLLSFKELDDANSPLTESPLLSLRPASPIEGDTPNLNLLRQKRRTRENEHAALAEMQDVLSILQSGSAVDSSKKMRQVSGGSQKSVTFSDHVDEHSFSEDFKSPDLSDVKSPSRDNHMPDSFTDGLEEDHSRPTSSPPLSNGHNIPDKESIFLSDFYLAPSPLPNRKREEPFTSPLDSKLLSESSQSPDSSMNLSAAVEDLLVPISPDLTPSRTPNLPSLRMSNDISPSQSFIPQTTDHDSFLGSTLHQADDLNGLEFEAFPYLEELSSLHLSGLTPATLGNKAVEVPMSLDLFDEDESILLPTSPTIRQEILVDIN